MATGLCIDVDEYADGMSNPLIVLRILFESPMFSQLARGLRQVTHETDSKEEIIVNYHKADVKRPIDAGLARAGISQMPAPERGVTPVSGKTTRSARHAQFQSLLEGHLPALSRVAYRLCRHRETAEDLVQETLLRAWKHLDKLRDEKSAKSWIFMILRREYARSFTRQTPAMVDIELERLTDGEFELSMDTMTLYDAIEILPDMYKVPMVLFAIGGYDIKEIASDLQLSGSTVKTRLFRAREKLREQLTGERRAVPNA